MTSKGPYNFPPRDRDQNCGRCSGYGWVPLSPTEKFLVDEVDSDHQTVFGTPYFGQGLGCEVPEKKLCPGCCGTERQIRHMRWIAKLRLTRRTLKALVNRVRRGENISAIARHFRDLETDEDVEDQMVLSLRDFARRGRLNEQAMGRRPKQARTPKKQRPSRDGLSGELAQLARLRRSADLTEDEFIRAKQKLLGQSSSKRKKKRAARRQDDEGPPDLPEESESP